MSYIWSAFIISLYPPKEMERVCLDYKLFILIHFIHIQVIDSHFLETQEYFIHRVQPDMKLIYLLHSGQNNKTNTHPLTCTFIKICLYTVVM